jgi:L-ribulose-5-phosphate 3-epimerase
LDPKHADYSMKLGIYEKFLQNNIALPVKLDMARKAGFEFMDIAVDETQELIDRLDWPLRERIKVRNATMGSGISIYGIVLSAHRKYPLGSASREIRQKAGEILGKAINLAYDIGARVIQIAGYYVFYDEPADSAEKWFLDGLCKGVDLASEAGIMLGLENVDGRDIISISKARQIVDYIGSPWMQLYPDLGNLVANGLNIRSELTAGRGHFVGIHLKDARLGEYRRVPFGDGIVPFNDAFRELKDIGYRGPFLLEMWGEGWSDPVEIISHSRRWMVDRMIESGLEIDTQESDSNN